MQNGKFICTPEDPWTPDKTPNSRTRIKHGNVIEIGDQRSGWPCGDIVRYKCVNCNHTWEEELPQ